MNATASDDGSQFGTDSKSEFLLSLLEDWIVEDETDDVGGGRDSTGQKPIGPDDRSGYATPRIPSPEIDQATTTTLYDNGVCQSGSATVNPSSSEEPSLESLAPDLSANVLQYLTVQEIVLVVATVSKKMHIASQRSDLWKLKFESRWNLGWSSHRKVDKDQELSPSSSLLYITDWYSAYRQGYENIHDLWITHWNIAYPHDGLSPGRCCITARQEGERNQTEFNVGNFSHNVIEQLCRLCPNCRNRHHQQNQPDINSALSSYSSSTKEKYPINSLAQATAAATMVRLHQTSNLDGTLQYHSISAQRAFATASTLHRTLSTNQYHAYNLAFLKDLLFFQTHQDRKELDDLKHSFKRLKETNQIESGTDAVDGNNHNDAGEQQPRRLPLQGSNGVHHQHYTDICETAAHSWHTVHFTNPDYIRPLVWRTSIQRPDCFTVYPSEGCLQPGESTLVVFGVRPLGSLIAHSMHQLNAHREGVEEIWASVYTEEAHLPAAPFLVHYNFTAAIPCQPAGKQGNAPLRLSTGDLGEVHDSNTNHRHGYLPSTGRGLSAPRSSWSSASPWELQRQAAGRLEPRRQPIRTIYLSAHVNGNYPLSEFWRSTLVPFMNVVEERRQQRAMTVYCAPHLKERDPIVHLQLENLKLECDENSSESQHAYFRTEAPCAICKRMWGARLEELMQAHVVARLECCIAKKQRDSSIQRIVEILRHLVRLCIVSNKDSRIVDAEQAGRYDDKEVLKQKRCTRQHRLLHTIMDRLVDLRGSRWMSLRQRQLLTQWEAVVDELCCIFNNTVEVTNPSVQDAIEDNMDNAGGNEPWRHAGVYRQELCTDSTSCHELTSSSHHAIDGLLGRIECDRASICRLLKEEPAYLEAFAHLAHSPGRFCLGPQEDPNHLHQQLYRERNRFIRQQSGFVSDMFMDDPISTMQSALCALYDPSSLLVHGIYDRIPYPGTLVRRPKVDLLPRLVAESFHDAFAMKYQRLLESPKRIAYYQLQDALDMEALRLVDSWVPKSSNGDQSFGGDRSSVSGMIASRLSLFNYLMNIPAPGMGRFPLCTKRSGDSETGRGEANARIDELIFETNSSRDSSRSHAPFDGDGRIDDTVDVPPTRENDAHNGNIPRDNQMPPMRGPRALNLLWIMSAHLGWTVDENDGSSVFVDRRILIGAQWFSISLMTAPLFWTLFASLSTTL